MPTSDVAKTYGNLKLSLQFSVASIEIIVIHCLLIGKDDLIRCVFKVTEKCIKN